MWSRGGRGTASTRRDSVCSSGRAPRGGRAWPATGTSTSARELVEVWDAEDFDPWESLRWPTVRVLRSRQHKPDGTVVEAYWLTDWPPRLVGRRALYAVGQRRGGGGDQGGE